MTHTITGLALLVAAWLKAKHLKVSVKIKVGCH
jgi:hypothetical protein